MTEGEVNGRGMAAEIMGINSSTHRNRMDKLGIPYRRGKEGERVKETDAKMKYLVLLQLNWRRTITLNPDPAVSTL